MSLLHTLFILQFLFHLLHNSQASCPHALNNNFIIRSTLIYLGTYSNQQFIVVDRPDCGSYKIFDIYIATHEYAEILNTTIVAKFSIVRNQHHFFLEVHAISISCIGSSSNICIDILIYHSGVLCSQMLIQPHLYGIHNIFKYSRLSHLSDEDYGLFRILGRQLDKANRGRNFPYLSLGTMAIL